MNALMVPLATWVSVALQLAGALTVAAVAYTGLRYIAFQRYRRRLREVTKREALTLERQRIAMDVHDDLGADLSNMLLRTRMALASGADPTGALREVETSASGMMHKIDEIIWSMDPRMDSLNSTLGFIEHRASDLVNGAGLSFRCTAGPVPVDRTVAAGFRRDIHLLVKEALNNVLKHAGAKEVHLIINADGHRLQFAVEDDGRGLPEESSGDRHGQVNMQRRAMKHSGSVTLAQLRPRGVRCEISVPIPQNHPKG